MKLGNTSKIFKENFVLVLIKKAATNFSFIYKIFYVFKLLDVWPVGISIGTDPTQFWANYQLYNYESKNITNRCRRFHISFRFVDDFCALKPCASKVKHNGNHATFQDLDISIGKDNFIYKCLKNKRDVFNVHIARMSSIISNIPSIIFYSSTMSKFGRIARSTLLLKEF